MSSRQTYWVYLFKKNIFFILFQVSTRTLVVSGDTDKDTVARNMNQCIICTMFMAFILMLMSVLFFLHRDHDDVKG